MRLAGASHFNGASMRQAILLVAAFVFVAPAAFAQTTPVTKRAVFPLGTSPTVQATATTARLSSTNAVTKEFFVAYGGNVFVTFKIRSNGLHTANWEAFFGGRSFAPCSGSTSSATWQEFGCGNDIEAGGKVRVILFPNGQTAGICCARLQFDLVNVNAAAVATGD